MIPKGAYPAVAVTVGFRESSMHYKKRSTHHPIEMQRRSFVFGSASALGLAARPLAISAGPAFAAERKITWGTNEAYSRPEMLQPFTEATGIEVDTALFSDPAELVTKLTAGGAGVDMMIDGSYHVDITHRAGVIQPLDRSAIPNLDAVIPAFRNAEGLSFDGQAYGVPLLWGTDSIVYRGDMVDGEINDIAALFDPKYAGRIAMPGGLLESLIVGAIYLGIEKPFDMDADDLDAVAELLIKQKPLLRTYWNDIGDLKNLMATGEVVLAWGWAPVLELAKDGIDIRWGFPSQGQLGWYDACYLTTEAEGQAKSDCEALMNYLLGDSYGVMLGEEAGYRTVSEKAIAEMPAEMRDSLSLDDPMSYLDSATWWVTPSDEQAYKDAWNRVLNA